MRTTSFSRPDYIPEALRLFAAKRAAEIAGLLLMALAAAFALALMSWSVEDPSWNHATRGSVRNFLGPGGAIAADLAMQLFGLASIAMVAPAGFWGWRLLSTRQLPRARLRVLLWLAGSAATAGLASALPVSDRWPLPTGLGGVLGDALQSLPHRALGASSLVSLVIAICFAAIAILALTAACGSRLQDAASRADRDDADEIALAQKPAVRRPVQRDAEEDADDEPGFGIVSLGAIVHAGLSLKASIARLWKARQAIARPALRAPWQIGRAHV